MNVAPFVNDRLYDAFLDIIVDDFGKSMKTDEDDGFILCIGGTGTGKTSLAMHAYERFDKEPNIEYVCLSKTEFARAIKTVKSKTGKRFLMYDEAQVSKREALSQWNRDLMKLYNKIRGKQIFHWWNNPTIEWIDKPFIEERVKGVIFVIGKSRNGQPRKYLFFTQKGILRLFEAKKKLTHHILKRYGPKYAFYMGWFKAYNGKLWPEYKAKKEINMDEEIDQFSEKYGKGDVQSIAQSARVIRVSEPTALRYAKRAIQEGVLPSECQAPSGMWHLNQEQVETLRSFIKRSREAKA